MDAGLHKRIGINYIFLFIFLLTTCKKQRLLNPNFRCFRCVIMWEMRSQNNTIDGTAGARAGGARHHVTTARKQTRGSAPSAGRAAQSGTKSLGRTDMVSNEPLGSASRYRTSARRTRCLLPGARLGVPPDGLSATNAEIY